MGDPAGPGKQYCTQCGESIDRNSQYCTYCGTPLKDREFPTDRSGPATASEDGPLGDTARTGERNARETNGRGEYRGPNAVHGEDSLTETYDQQYADESEGRDFDTPRVGMGSIAEPRWSEFKPRTVGVAAGMGVLGVILLVVFSAIVGAVFIGLQLPELAALGIATAIGQYLGFMGLGFFYLRNRGYDWELVKSYLGFRLPSLKEIGLVILGWITILVLILIVGAIVEAFLPEPADNEGASMLAEASGNIGLYFGAVAFMFLVVGPCEEVLYRGIVQNRLRERLAAIPSILIASVVFASVHVVALSGGNLLAMATTVGVLFVPAIVLGAVYEYTGNIVVPSLLHGLHNSFIITVIFFGPSVEEAAGFLETVYSILPV